MISKNLNVFTMIPILFLFFTILFLPMLVLYFVNKIFLNYIVNNLLVILPIYFYLNIFLYTLLFIIETILILRIFEPKNKEGIFSISKVTPEVIYYFLNDVFIKIVEKLFFILLLPTSLIGEIIFKIFNGKTGRNVLFNPVNDPYLIEIGTNSIIGQDVKILGHEIVGNKIILKKVKIGKNVTIGANAIISCGTIIEDNVIVGANSFVKKNSILKKNSLYVGSPVQLKRKLK